MTAEQKRRAGWVVDRQARDGALRLEHADGVGPTEWRVVATHIGVDREIAWSRNREQLLMAFWAAERTMAFLLEGS